MSDFDKRGVNYRLPTDMPIYFETLMSPIGEMRFTIVTKDEFWKGTRFSPKALEKMSALGKFELLFEIAKKYLEDNKGDKDE